LVPRPRSRLRHACVALTGEAARVDVEESPPGDRACEAARVEPFGRAVKAPIGLNTATAIHLAAGVGELQLLGLVRLVGVLIAQRVGQVVVERAVPWPL